MVVTSFSRVIPYEGVDHAGGEYVLRHLRALASIARVAVIAPDEARNWRALAKVDIEPFESLVIRSSRQSRLLLNRLRRKVDAFVDPARTPVGQVADAERSHSVRALLRASTHVEYQWSENLDYVRLGQRLAPGARHIAVAHDVMEQRYQRERDTARDPLRRLLRAGVLLGVRRRERRGLNRVDDVIVFSEKDSDLLRRAGVKPPIHVVVPALSVAEMRSFSYGPTEHVLFVGNMGRSENDEAARWFIEEVWPSVRALRRNARFIVAGVGPSAALMELILRAEGVVATGYVPTLDPYYMSAGVVVVPVQRGAGIKFKTLTAMLWGIPVVSTPVGADGVGTVDLYARVTDVPTEFAEAVAAAIGADDGVRRRATDAQVWARSVAGDRQYENALLSIYRGAASPAD